MKSNSKLRFNIFFHIRKNFSSYYVLTMNRESPTKKKKTPAPDSDDSSDDDIIGVVYGVHDGDDANGDDALKDDPSDDGDDANYDNQEVDGDDDKLLDASNGEVDSEYNEVVKDKPMKKRFVLRIAHGKSNAPGFTTESDWAETSDNGMNSDSDDSSMDEDDIALNDDKKEDDSISSSEDEGTS